MGWFERREDRLSLSAEVKIHLVNKEKMDRGLRKAILKVGIYKIKFY